MTPTTTTARVPHLNRPHRLRWGRTLLLLALLTPATLTAQAPPQPPHEDWATGLDRELPTLGKPAWRPMLAYDILLHRADTHPAAPPFAFPWEDTGRGYGYGPGTGHWDLVHEILDVIPAAPQHAREQLLNDVRLQLPSGFLPGLYWMRQQTAADDPHIYDSASARYSPTQGNPPVWVVAADDFLQSEEARTGHYDTALASEFLKTVSLQIAWFERERRAQPDGFLYLDIVTHKWESGVDEGVRFDGLGLDGAKPTSTACIDATAHVYQMDVYAARWARRLGRPAAAFDAKADHLRHFIQTRLWSERDGFFYDSWVLDRAPDGPPETWHNTPTPGRSHALEGFWPMVVGAATPLQASRVLTEWLLNPARFFTPHPLATVALDDPKFSNRMWRGPVWNSMTYWAARGAIRYGFLFEAHRLLEPALDDSAAQFDRSGLIWEFYSPTNAHPEDLTRKPQTKRNQPFPDYLGHNPLLAMARLWQQTL
jgi:putative isomerase